MNDPTTEVPLELHHAIRHLVAARFALAGGEPCTARAHLREARADIHWALKPVTVACNAYLDDSFREGARRLAEGTGRT